MIYITPKLLDGTRQRGVDSRVPTPQAEMEIDMTNKKCDVFQSTYLGDPNDPDKDPNWGNMWKTIQNGKQPFKYMDRLEIAFADIRAEDPDNAFLSYTGPNSDKATKTIAEAKKQTRLSKLSLKWVGHRG